MGFIALASLASPSTSASLIPAPDPTTITNGLTDLMDSMNIAGYCASSSSDVGFHAAHTSKAACESPACKDCEWISREHHLSTSRRLDAMEPEEKAIFILNVKADVVLSSDVISSWESKYHVDFSHYISSRNSGGYFYVHVTAATASMLRDQAEFVSDVLPVPDAWKQSPILSEGIRKDVFFNSDVADFTILKVLLGACKDATLVQTNNLVAEWSQALQQYNIEMEVNTVDEIVLRKIPATQFIQVVSFLTLQPSVMWIEPAMKYKANNIEAAALLQNGAAR
jgi:hypothetical protein